MASVCAALPSVSEKASTSASTEMRSATRLLPPPCSPWPWPCPADIRYPPERILASVHRGRLTRRRASAAELRPRNAGERHRCPGQLERRKGLAEREPRDHAGDRRRQIHERRRARDAARCVDPRPNHPAAERGDDNRPEEPE